MLIVDKLESLWDGFTIDKTYEHPEGKNICAALVLVSCDVLVARKICRHILALVSYYICEKKVNYKNHQYNLPKWIILMIGSLCEIQLSIIKMR